jgi:hypothetical protein
MCNPKFFQLAVCSLFASTVEGLSLIGNEALTSGLGAHTVGSLGGRVTVGDQTPKVFLQFTHSSSFIKAPQPSQ